MTQTEAFALIDAQLERDFKNCNAPRNAKDARLLIRAHTVLKLTLVRRKRAALKREREERLMKGEI